jgi:hypothetical protein
VHFVTDAVLHVAKMAPPEVPLFSWQSLKWQPSMTMDIVAFTKMAPPFVVLEWWPVKEQPWIREHEWVAGILIGPEQSQASDREEHRRSASIRFAN